ncbi:MAG TPA: rhodanese-like domain-containing protein [Candidatus Paceibacterota bacterium]|nr:rhodanese-like domain-containing protein [Candidatus Paceibacterota bacterium]
MLKKISPATRVPLAICGTVLLAAILFYGTPLRYLDPVDPGMQDVDPAALSAAMQAHPQQYLVLDVRQASAYEAGHIQGALSEPIANLYDDRFVLPKTGKTIVLVCGDGRLAAIAYGYLEHYGFLNLLRISGGLQAWQAEGLPVVKGTS